MGKRRTRHGGLEIMDLLNGADRLPYLTTQQMVEVDRAMMDDYRIDLVRMMENAGRNLAHLARLRFLNRDPRDKRVVVLAGTGANGGGALVAARRLSNWGSAVEVLVISADRRFAPVARHQLDILRRMRVAISAADRSAEAGVPDVVLDGIFGYGLKGAPRGVAASLIRWANSCGAPVLALDAPSGLDTTNGTVYAPTIRATATMTLALPKEGLRQTGVEQDVGELYLADIGVPPQLYARPPLGLDVGPVFATADVVRLR